MSAGKLVPDEVVIEVVRTRLSQPDVASGFLLDGFPRTAPQAQELDRILSGKKQKIDAVLSITLDDEEIVKRLSSRRVCPACGGSFNLVSQPPKVAEKCDYCGAAIVQRADDNPGTIRQRLKAYHEQTSPLTDYYSRKGVLCTVDGAKPVEKVFESIGACIKG
jgi:adenylate kinase